MTKIFCESCNKSYTTQYYNNSHCKSKIHLKKLENFKNNQILKEHKENELKVNMLKDIQELYEKYGESIIEKEICGDKIEKLRKELDSIEIIEEEVIEGVEPHKICKTCKTTKTLGSFDNEGRTKDGKRASCKECRSKRKKELIKVKEEKVKNDTEMDLWFQELGY